MDSSNLVFNYNQDPSLSNYVFSLYTFQTVTPDSGTWCNSDNPNFFSGPQTTLTLHGTDTVSVNPDVFLLFKNVKCMIHVYETTTGYFDYQFAPLGYECTAVAV